MSRDSLTPFGANPRSTEFGARNRENLIRPIERPVTAQGHAGECPEWEGMRKAVDGNWQSHYHGYKPQGSPRGASYLYFVDSVPDACAFENYLREHPRSVDIWLGGHTHTHPDDTYGGKAHVETKWETHFINAASLTRYHGQLSVPKSRLITFTKGRLITFTKGRPEARVRCYMHTSEFLPQGWYDRAERTLTLSRPFSG